MCWLWLLSASTASAQLSGVQLEGRIPTQLQGCITPESLKIGYQHGMAAIGMTDTRGVNLVVKLQTLPSNDPNTMRIELTAISWGRPLGTRRLRVKASDCAALPRGFGDVIARMAYEATAQDVSRRRQLIAPPPFQEEATAIESPPPSEYVALGAGAAVAGAQLPATALGLQLQASSTNYPVSLRLKVALLWPQRHKLPEGEIVAYAIDIALEMCPGFRLPNWERLALRVCIGPRVSVEHARAQRFPTPDQSMERAFIYFGFTPEAALRLSGATWLQLSAGLALGIVRPPIQLGVDSQRRSVELPDASPLRRELIASIVQVF